MSIINYMSVVFFFLFSLFMMKFVSLKHVFGLIFFLLEYQIDGYYVNNHIICVSYLMIKLFRQSADNIVNLLYFIIKI